MLAEKLGKTVNELLRSITSAELTEWMAYMLTQDEAWVKKYQQEIQQEKLLSMSREEQVQYLQQLLAPKNKTK